MNYRFSLFSFNILCDRYCTMSQYPYCPDWARAWSYRRKIIYDQLMNANADIICLQEVETDQHNHFFLPELAKLGYSGVHFPKTRSKTMSDEKKIHVDGCSIFFRLSKFILLKDFVIEFNKSLSPFSTGCDPIYNRVMIRDNTA